MAERKGAIQMSLGFIVAVVFAVVLLSLALAWINAIFPTLTDITYKVTDTARAKLLDEMASSNDKVGIAAPPVTKWRKGETGSYAIGIRNIEADSRLNAYLSIYLSELGGELAGRSVSEYASDVDKWLTYSKREIIEPSEQKTTDLIIKPDTGATPGIYAFTVVVCESPACTDLDSASMYGYVRFALEIQP